MRSFKSSDSEECILLSYISAVETFHKFVVSANSRTLEMCPFSDVLESLFDVYFTVFLNLTSIFQISYFHSYFYFHQHSPRSAKNLFVIPAGPLRGELTVSPRVCLSLCLCKTFQFVCQFVCSYGCRDTLHANVQCLVLVEIPRRHSVSNVSVPLGLLTLSL